MSDIYYAYNFFLILIIQCHAINIIYSTSIVTMRPAGHQQPIPKLMCCCTLALGNLSLDPLHNHVLILTDDHEVVM